MAKKSGLDTLYNVMMRFIPEDEALPDEIEAIEQGRADYERGEVIRLEDMQLGKYPQLFIGGVEVRYQCRALGMRLCTNAETHTG